VLSVAFSPEGGRIVSGSADKTLRVWDAAQAGDTVRIRGHRGPILVSAFSVDGRQLATGAKDGTIIIWNTSTGLAEQTLKNRATEVLSLVFSGDGRRLASITRDGALRTWDLFSGTQMANIQNVTAPAQIVAFDRAGQRVAVRSGATRVQVWNFTTGKCDEDVTGVVQLHAITARHGLILSQSAYYGSLRPRALEFETAFEHHTRGGADALAWFPARLPNAIAHPSGRTWAGFVDRHLYLLRLEGELA
jgi:WD40 repeat protein